MRDISPNADDYLLLSTERDAMSTFSAVKIEDVADLAPTTRRIAIFVAR